MSIIYRQLSLADLGLLQATGRESYEPYYAQIWNPGGLDWYMDRCFGADVISAELVNPDIEYWLASDEKAQRIGFLKLVWKKSPPDGPELNALYLEKIYLMPAFFGLGKGQELIRFAKQRALETDCEAIWLLVMKSGPVWTYERAGFRITGEIHWDFEFLKPEERDGLLMICPLQQP